jgi:beta-galactosidase
MTSKHISWILFLAGALAAFSNAAEQSKSLAGVTRERLSMDRDWRFHLGEMGSPAISGKVIDSWRWTADDRGLSSAGEMAVPNLDNTAPRWKTAQPKEDVFHGRRGFAWFRATLPPMDGGHVRVNFAGVDDNGTVFLNGRKLAYHEGWSDPFEVSLDPAWKPGGPNVLAVLVENIDGPGGIDVATLTSDQTPTPADSVAGKEYDETGWRKVNVPHDFVVEGDFDQSADRSHGFRHGDIGWYRRAFFLPESDRGKRVWLDFEGIYRDSTVWVNGHRLGKHASGYTPSHYDISDVAHFGGKNEVAVRVDGKSHEGWWYEGGGIYRHVWLTKVDPVHVIPYGVYVTSQVPDPRDGDTAPASTQVEVTVENSAGLPADFQVRSDIQDATGAVVGSAETPGRVEPGARTALHQAISLAPAMLWSCEHPYLYNLVTTVLEGDRTIDCVRTPFGIRTIRFDADRGFFLNGKPVKIKGTCNHQDFAGIGIALPDAIHYFKIRKLKEMGSNGYRCSHHPYDPVIMDACDQLGMLVMDENRRLGDSPEIILQVETMVMRDRNHPSVIMWSLCNEEGKQGTPEGEKMGRAMKEVIEKYDTTRPVTAAMNGGYTGGLINVVDVQGFNYNSGQYDVFHKEHPTQPCFGSETASATYTRGIYRTEKDAGFVSAYGSGEGAWRPVAERDFMAGGFVWTGFDYRGEPTPYSWPCINSHFGIMDSCGFPKDDYYYYLSWWGRNPVLHLMPHWNKPDEPGDVKVRCYSNCARVELFLNGRSLGMQEMKPNQHLEWKVPWQPGTLSARGFDAQGNLVQETKVETTGEPAEVALSPDRSGIGADGSDVSVVAVEVRDALNRIVPTANNEVSFQVTGGRIIGVGNGNPSSHESDKLTKRKTFNGLCLVLIQSDRMSGPIELTATSPGLQAAHVTIQATPAGIGPEAP